ncbi:MAG TPA: hypothetical protein VFB58_09740 [Chloroflexota bacterium]|nr:hypothetical protein [Chloroflexota bacterium]
MSDISIPREPRPTGSPLIRNLTIAASGLTAASIAVNLILQIAHYMKKRPVQPDQRDRIQAVQLVIMILKTSPGLVKQVRLFVDQLQGKA